MESSTVERRENGTHPNENEIYMEFSDIAEDGETWFLISKKWVEKWKNYCGIAGTGNEHPGPIDNSELLEEDGKSLKLHLLEDVEYCVLPKSAWSKLVNLYNLGQDQEPIARKAITVGTYTKETVVEVYPPVMTLSRHDSDHTIKEAFSRVENMETVHSKMRSLFGISSDRKTRIYIKDSVDAVKLDKSLEDNGIGPNQVLVLEAQNEDGTWPRFSPPPPSYTEAVKPAVTHKGTISNSHYSSYNNYSTRSSSTNSWSAKKVKAGLCGLSNLGNTCFMNSAIQCLSNVPLLTMYFREKKYKKEINETNPIGMGGRLAEAYAALINDMWSGNNSSVAPRDFKYNVGTFAPRFTGYQQHDSQELLAFLIDGLHEDLNRIAKKPYVELKASDGRPDSVVAEEAWRNHLQRNDSVIVDMFHGLFRSTLVCPDPECNRVSVTFDPFGFLSLPLAKSREVSVICNFVPKDGNKPVNRCNISVPKDGTFKDLVKKLASVFDCQAKNIVVTDVYNHRFYKVYKGYERLSSYSERDNLYAFELDFEDDEEVEYAKVYMREIRNISKPLFGHPFMIPVKSGVTTYRKLYNSVLLSVSRYVKPEYRDDVKTLSETKEADANNLMESETNENGANPDELNDQCDDAKQESEDKPEEEQKWFELVAINSFGTSVVSCIEDNDKPLKFGNDVYFAAEWSSKTLEDYSVDDWSEEIESHSSMREKPLKDKGCSLAQCMSLFTSEEQLGEHDLWYCPECKDHKQATKKIDIWSLPPVLIIHLKRFSNTRWSREKISTLVNFPTKDLDLSDFIINPEKSKWEPEKKKYDLIGVANHFGGMGGGHYTAYALNFLEEKWYDFNDSCVSETSESKVQTNAAYVLMYQRQDITRQVKNGRVESIKFLESMVSPRNFNKQFSFGEGVNSLDESMTIGDKESMDPPTPMDTS